MGQCGCGDFDGLAWFDGPEGYVYVIEVFDGCLDCETGPGVVITRMSHEEAKGLNLPRWNYSGDLSWNGIPVVDRAVLKARLDAFHEAHLEEYEIDGFIHDAVPEALRDACGETVDKWRASVKRQGRR